MRVLLANQNRVNILNEEILLSQSHLRKRIRKCRVERKDRIYYLGVLLDKTVFSRLCTQSSRNNGIIAKLRRYLTLSLSQAEIISLYYHFSSHTLFYFSLGKCMSITHAKKMQTKMHDTIRLAFSEETVQLVIKQIVLSLSRFSNSKQLLSISCKRTHTVVA